MKDLGLRSRASVLTSWETSFTDEETDPTNYKDCVLEIHGSLSRVQCSVPCCNELYDVTEEKLEE